MSTVTVIVSRMCDSQFHRGRSLYYIIHTQDTAVRNNTDRPAILHKTALIISGASRLWSSVGLMMEAKIWEKLHPNSISFGNLDREMASGLFFTRYLLNFNSV